MIYLEMVMLIWAFSSYFFSSLEIVLKNEWFCQPMQFFLPFVF